MVVIFMLLVCLFPIKAFADYTNASVNITASVQSNGSIRIVEQRAIDFDEPYSGISFRFTGLPSDAELEVMSVRLAPMEGESIAGDWVSLPQDSFQSGWREAFGNERAHDFGAGSSCPRESAFRIGQFAYYARWHMGAR